MHPVWIHLGGFPLASYGTALCLAFVAGTWVAYRRAAARGLDGERVLELATLSVVTSLLGARALHLALYWEHFGGAGIAALLLPQPGEGGFVGVAGMSVMGGLPAALAASALYLRWRRLPALAYMDLLAPSVALGASITRVGCFLNGCCFGRVCDLPWGVRFPDGSLPASVFPGATLHPTQLYAAAAGAVLFALLRVVERRRPAPGVVVAWLCVGMGAQRFAIELARYHDGDEILLRAAGIEWTTYQAVALTLCAVGGLLLAARRSHLPGAEPA